MTILAPPSTSPSQAPHRHHRLRTTLVVVAVTVLALASVFLLGGGWYFSGRIHNKMLDASVNAPTYNLHVVPDGGNAVVVSGTAGQALPDILGTDATYALRLPGQTRTYVLGPVSSSGADSATRSVSPATLAAIGNGTSANAYREIWLTPTGAGEPYRTVALTGETGALPSWVVPGHGAWRTTWVVHVHGKGHLLAEGLRASVPLHRLGVTQLFAGYRGDAGAPPMAGNINDFGAQSWQDVQSAVQYALDHGAQHVVLMGYSMGGTLVASFLSHSALATDVDAVVLDSPMLDVNRTIAYGASQSDLPVVGLPVPGVLTWSATQIARLRYGSDWYNASYLDDTSWLTVPTLVLHGSDDQTVPVSTSRQLAQERPDDVTLVVTPGAGHVESWNVDPTAYDAALTSFLQTALR